MDLDRTRSDRAFRRSCLRRGSRHAFRCSSFYRSGKESAWSRHRFQLRPCLPCRGWRQRVECTTDLHERLVKSPAELAAGCLVFLVLRI